MVQQTPSSLFDNIPVTEGDAIFALMGEYQNDSATEKANLTAGVYRDDDGKPWVLPTVRKAEKMLFSDPRIDHEYPPIAGLPSFIASARDILFAHPPPSFVNRCASIQTISGTGACHIGAKFLHSVLKPRTIWVSNPTWSNHHLILSIAAPDTEQKFYPYFDATNNRFDCAGMLQTLESEAEEGDIILLHACAHNPTGLDPSQDEWRHIADLCERKHLFPFFDSAYQGFASGNPDTDAWAVRHFVERGTMELCVAQSFSKNFGLYGQRVGAFHLLASTPDARDRAYGLLADLQRGEISMPPIYGARIVDTILRDAELYKSWQDDLTTMAERIKGMRQALYDELVRLDTPGNWEHIVKQSGMFSYTGLSEAQVAKLKEKHVYMLKSGRASISGLNERNVGLVARVIDAAVRETVTGGAKDRVNGKENGKMYGHHVNGNGVNKDNVLDAPHVEPEAVENKRFAQVDA